MAKGHVRRKGKAWQVIVPAGRDAETGKYRYITRTVHGLKRDAEKVCAELLVDVGEGRVSTARSTFGELLTRWLPFKEPDLSPSTARETRRIVDRRLLPALGSVPLAKLTPARLDRYYMDLRKAGLLPASIRRIHVVIRSALAQAVRWGLLRMNPAASASPPKVPRSRVSAPTTNDVTALLAVAAAERPDLVAFLRLAAITGARRGELCGLRWSDLDMDRRQLTISRSVVLGPDGPVERDRGKTDGSTRRIALDAETIAVLEAHRGQMAERARACGTDLVPDALLFSNEPDCSGPWRPDSVTRSFGWLRKKVGLDGVRLHDLRHYVATRLIAAGTPVRAVSERLGHANAATTLGIYSHFVEATDQASAEVLARLLDSSVGDAASR